MYIDYFKLNEFPFSLVSDPRYLYMSGNHTKVASYLHYAMKVQDSFVVITGEIGTGKTTLINYALATASPRCVLLNIQSASFTNEELLQSILLEAGVEPFGLSRIQMLEKLKNYLISQQMVRKKVFLIIDEAHTLDKYSLDEIRYFSDLEYKNEKLLNVIVVGQPELNKKLDQPEMEHFLQRVRLRAHIKPLKEEEMEPYIQHRLKIAGAHHPDLFTPQSYADIYQFTGGRLRLINTLCDYALMFCFVENMQKVNSMVVQKSANELRWEVYEKRFGSQSDITRFLPAESKPEAVSATLVLKRAGKKIGEYSLGEAALSIGRDKSNEIVLDGYKVSRKHAQISWQGGQYYLHDLGSTNGIYSNGEKIGVKAIEDGEEFSIDDYHFLLRTAPRQQEISPRLDEVENDQTRIYFLKDNTQRFQARARAQLERENI